MVFLAKLSKKEKIGLFIGVGFISLALLDRVIIGPVNNKIQQINQEVKTNEKQLSRDLRNLNQEEVITKTYQKYVGYVKKVGSDEEEAAKILSEIEELAGKSAVYLADMKPRSPKQVNFYKEYSIEIEAEGEMVSLVNFLYQLNNSPLLLRAEKLRFSLKSKDSRIVKTSILITKVSIP